MCVYAYIHTRVMHVVKRNWLDKGVFSEHCKNKMQQSGIHFWAIL